MAEIIKVVGAVIFDDKIDSYFVGQRGRYKRHPLKWEFIGGKVEKQDLDDLLRATEREFEEEVHQEIKALKLLHTFNYDYGAEVGEVEINFVECQKFEGVPKFDREVYETCEWVSRNKMLTLDWIEADRDFALKLANEKRFN